MLWIIKKRQSWVEFYYLSQIDHIYSITEQSDDGKIMRNKENNGSEIQDQIHDTRIP